MSGFSTTYLNKHEALTLFPVFLLWQMVCAVLMCCRLKLETPNNTYGFIFLWCPLPLKRENRDVHHLLSTICTERQKTNKEFSTSNVKYVCICVAEMWEGSLRNVGGKENWHVLYEGLLRNFLPQPATSTEVEKKVLQVVLHIPWEPLTESDRCDLGDVMTCAWLLGWCVYWYLRSHFGISLYYLKGGMMEGEDILRWFHSRGLSASNDGNTSDKCGGGFPGTEALLSKLSARWKVAFPTPWNCNQKFTLRSMLLLPLLSFSVVSDSLWPHVLKPAKLLCPWNFPGKNTEMGWHFLSKGIFLT